MKLGRPATIEYKKLTRECPTCHKIVFHKSGKSRYNSERANVSCVFCKNSGIRNPFFGKRHSEQQKAIFRERKTLDVVNRFHGPHFNRVACEFFNMLNDFMGWNGVHALNGGEYNVDGYFLDYFEPRENLVIEWDEPHHFKPSQQKKDKIRATNIKEILACEFWRVNSETLEFREFE
jgi:hypothetical protein